MLTRLYVTALPLLCCFLSTCFFTDFQRCLLQILAAEECEVSVVSKTVHLDDALQGHVCLGKQTLNLDNTLFLHPAIRRVVELLLEHIVEVLDAETADVGKLLDCLYTWSIVTHQRRKRLVAIEYIVERTQLYLRRIEELEDDKHLLYLGAVQMVTLHIV